MTSLPPKSVEQVESFLKLETCSFKIENKNDAYQFIRKTTFSLNYKKQTKKNKGRIKEYLSRITGYSQIQTKRLIGQSIKGKLEYVKKKANKTSYKKKYSNEDIKLLAQLDEAAHQPNGFAIKENIRRMVEIYHDERFKPLLHVSNGSIYNFRKTSVYRQTTASYTHTSPVQNAIGIRMKPDPNGKPGYIRVDSVHGGDKEFKKGVYYVNLVDEVTQFEIVVCVQGISERYLKEVWKYILVSFPFDIINFHSDNGSEFINNIVAQILARLNISQTKSRPRHSGDNGLVETKNGWVIRKHFGYVYVDQRLAPLINMHLERYFNDYLNYHRPCAYPKKIMDKRGKIKISYKSQDYMTPYEKLKLSDPEGKSLREGNTYAILNKIAYVKSDFEFMQEMNRMYMKMREDVKLAFNQLNS